MTRQIHQPLYDNLVIPPEMFDFIEIMRMGAIKHGPNNWLTKDGNKSDEKSMHDSMFHHLAQSFTEKAKAKDPDSGLDPLLHLACRALMLYTRRKKNLVHKLDE